MTNQPADNEAYGSFTGEINADRVEILIGQLNRWITCKCVHILWNCPGGEVSPAITLYTYFRGYPTELILYASQAYSAGAVAFLGAKTRHAEKSASFMIHGVVSKFPDGHLVTIQELTETLAIAQADNQRVHAIIDANLENLPTEENDYRIKELRLNATQASHAGFLTVAEKGKLGTPFGPPPATRIFTLGRDPNDFRSGCFPH